MDRLTTYEFIVQLDLHEGAKRISPTRVAKAIYRAIEHTLDSDVEGAEVLDSRWGQVTVKPLTVSPSIRE